MQFLILMLALKRRYRDVQTQQRAGFFYHCNKAPLCDGNGSPLKMAEKTRHISLLCRRSR